MSKRKVGVVGGTGYTGMELIRLLVQHSEVSLEIVTARSEAGTKYSKVYPSFEGIYDDPLRPIDDLAGMDLDLVFLALPHRVSMNFVKEYGLDSFRIIDLSGDFRLHKQAVYEEWYEKDHVCPEYLQQAAYGLPELNRDEIRNSDLVANPGCYPTSSILALAPLLKQKMVEPGTIIVDAKSGVTGAGAKPKETTHFPNLFGNFYAYGLGRHRHTPEIEQILGGLSGNEVQIQFTPHLLPIDRGILSTTYSVPNGPVSKELIRETFLGFYEKEYFVRVLDTPPSVKNVRGSNFCDLYATYDERTNRIITISAIDNLVKGAAGQAVQNMNLMFRLIEKSGLEHSPLNP
ncbi:MAG: N-acetyl-gamma-glutamyl-phosphate reductase [Balneolaceae bacterium]